MKLSSKITTALLFSGLSLSSLPAGAVSPNSEWTLIRNNIGGTTFTNMSPSATSFCYLSRVGVTETDTSAETADCQVSRGPVVWTLTATLGTTSDADVRCSAYCYNK